MKKSHRTKREKSENQTIKRGFYLNTTPQMTCFRGAKVCTTMASGKNDDRSIQSDNKLGLGTSYKLKLGPR